MNYKKQSIITLVSMFLVLLIAGAFTFKQLDRITDKMNRVANDLLLNSTRVIQSSLNNELMSDEQMLKVFAQLFSLSGGVNHPIDTLSGYVAATDFFNFTYMDLTGSGVNSEGEAVSAASLPFEEIALSQGASGYSDAYVGSSGRPQITFQVPVFMDSVQVGALYADKTLAHYNSSALFTFNGGAGLAYVVCGDNGSWIIEGTGTDNDTIYEFLADQGNGPKICQTLKELLVKGSTGTIALTFNGRKSYLCFLPLDNNYNWYLISVIPKGVLQKESAEVMQMITIVLAGLLVMAVLAAMLLLSRQTMKNREKSRIRQDQLFQNISSNVDFVFLLYSPAKRRVEMVSANVRTLFGLDPTQVSRQPKALFDACGMPAGDQEEFFCGNLKGKLQKEYRIGSANELQRWIEIHLIPADNGQYLAVLHDTTAEHHMRDDLADALQQSQENNRARSAFFSSMSHDIRTPMNGIVGMTAIAMSNLENPKKVRDCLQKISMASDHLLSLINEILEMSRMESGKFALKKEPVNLPELISNMLAFIKPEAVQKSLTLEVKSAAMMHDTIISDSLHLQKILLNLLSNAVKYTPDGGSVHVCFEEQPRAGQQIDLCFSVEDNGIGMSSDFLERLFIPFERAQDSRVSKIVGTGLGMAITKNIVDMMDGTISVTSRLGAGSKFVITLPVDLPDGVDTDISLLAGHPVLMVSDEETAREGIKGMLEQAGMHAVCVSDGRAAAEEVQRARRDGTAYSAVLIDLHQPDTEGIEAVRQIRSLGKDNSPAILLAAYSLGEVESEAIKAGVNDFLTKPVFRAELLHKLMRCLSEPAARYTESFEKVPPKIHLEGIRILVAEDNELNREIIVELLQNSGISVECAEDGLLAVQAVAGHAAGYYDMVLMDIHMPVMDGYAAAKAIRKIEGAGGMPIIAMTADAFDEDIRKCLAAGMSSHISKPVNIANMFEVIQKYCKKESGKKS